MFSDASGFVYPADYMAPPGDMCATPVDVLFDRAARRWATRTAIESPEFTWSYAELRSHVERLAGLLIAAGAASPDHPVALWMPTAAPVIAAMLATLRAGGFYVVIEPHYPDERNAAILADSQAGWVVTDTTHTAAAARHFAADRILHWDAAAPSPPPLAPRSTADPASILYTSGTTGVPKGVLHAHTFILNWSRLFIEDLHLAPSDRVALLYSASVAGAIRDTYGTLLSGGTLLPMVPRDLSFDALAQRLRDGRVTIYHSVATLFRHLITSQQTVTQFPDVRALVFGGERVLTRDLELIRARFPADALVYTSIGSTETGTFARLFLRSDYDPGGPTVPLGIVPPERSVRIVDEAGNPVPDGEIGEMVVECRYLADGYWRRPDDTARAFGDAPDRPGFRRYRTGDRGVRDSDGVLSHAGRTDRQFKIRGYRIEADEIEAVLLKLPGIRNAVVRAEVASGEDPSLTAYIEGIAPQELDASELRRACATHLPPHMVPATFVAFEQFPRLPNGKVDLRGLAHAPVPAAAHADSELALREAADVRQMWAALFPEATLSPDADFFALGGHSLMAMRLINRVNELLGATVPVALLFRHPTLGAFEAALAAWHADGADRIERLPRREDPDTPAVIAPASFSQERLWALHGSAAEPAAYNIAHGFRLDHPLDAGRLQTALDALVARHEALRTVFHPRDGVLEQVVQQRGQWPLTQLAIDTLEAPEQHPLLRDEARRPFDIAHGPLVRATLARSPRENFLLLVFHHSIVDGWSLRLLYRELSERYAAPQAATVPPPAIQPADHAAWQRTAADTPLWAADMAFWRERLMQVSEPLDLPMDHVANDDEAVVGAVAQRVLPAELVDALNTFSAHQHATLFMVLLAAYATLLQRHSGQERLLIGIPAAGRDRPELRDTIGFFINTLPLVLDLNPAASFVERVADVRRACLDAYAHADIPLAALRRTLPRDTQALTRLTTLFILQDLEERRLVLDGHGACGRTLPNGTAKFPLSLLAYPEADGLHLHAEYAIRGWRHDRVEGLLEQFEMLLAHAMAKPDHSVLDLALCSPKQAATVAAWSARPTPYPRDRSVGSLFVEQARRAPERIALSRGARTLTYGELADAARNVAAGLQAEAMPRGAHIGVAGPRGFDRVIHMLGTVLAGGVYVPLDGAAPPDRLRDMARDADLWAVLGTHPSSDDWCPASVRRFDLAATGKARAFVEPSIAATDPIYLMYTSGSTGTPKGSRIAHRGVVRLVTGTDTMPFGPDNVFLQLASFAFDAATFEMWGALLHGARLAIPPTGHLSPRELGEVIAREGVTTLWLTAGLFHLVVDEAIDALAPLKHLLAGGDVLSVDHVRRVRDRFPTLQLVNGYGPTENTTFSCCHRITEVDKDTLSIPRGSHDGMAPCRLARQGPEIGVERQAFPPQSPASATQGREGRRHNEDRCSIPIGRPVCNSTVAVVDTWRHRCPVGQAGELWLGGDGLSLGYWNRPELNARAFVDALEGQAGRWYRSGDYVRWRPDGVLEFLGRRDAQVKIRGFRVELDAIRRLIREQPGVQDCAVRAWAFERGDATLTAYVVAQPDGAPDIARIVAACRRELPPHEVPSFVVPVDVLPLTPNGKLDVDRLPSPSRPALAADSGPLTPRERIVADVWTELFPGHTIGPDADFFDLGGHSLLAARAIARLEAASGRRLSLNDLFWNPTVRGLAAVLAHDGDDSAPRSVVPLRTGGDRPPFFFVHGIRGDVFAFTGVVRHLPATQPVYGLQAVTGEEGDAAEESVTRIAARYADNIRAIQAQGPYSLGGYSIGGILAHAIAAELVRRGEKVAMLAILDTRPSNLPWPIYLRMMAPYLASRLSRHGRTLLRLRTADAMRAYLGGRWRALRIHAGRNRMAAAADREDPRRSDLPETASDPFEYLVRRYRPQPYPGTAHIFQAEGTAFNLAVGWRYLARGGVYVSRVPGQHLDILDDEHVARFTEIFGQHLFSAQEQ